MRLPPVAMPGSLTVLHPGAAAPARRWPAQRFAAVASVLRRIRPDIWAKGGDYSGVPLPESAVLAEWGGEAVTVPYLQGRSTSALVELARHAEFAGGSA